MNAQVDPVIRAMSNDRLAQDLEVLAKPLVAALPAPLADGLLIEAARRLRGGTPAPPDGGPPAA